MATNMTGHELGQLKVAPLVKSVGALLGLAAILYVAFAPGGHALPLSRMASGIAPENRSANPGPASEQPSGPRECQISAGIDTACTFQ
jgi:hypothetical protein